MLKFGSRSDVTVVHRATIRLFDDNEIIYCDFQVRAPHRLTPLRVAPRYPPSATSLATPVRISLFHSRAVIHEYRRRTENKLESCLSFGPVYSDSSLFQRQTLGHRIPIFVETG